MHMQACEDVLKNLVFLTLIVREEEREVGKEGKQERVKWKRREGGSREEGRTREKGGSLISFIYLGLMSFIPLKKTQVFINFAKDQKSYENVDTSSHGSSISVDSQDGQRES